MELMAQMGNDGSYTCQYWRREAGQQIVSENSNSIIVPVSDPPPQPELSVDPPSGVVGEGLPLLITCTAPEDTSERRFHFYKDGAELIPRDVGSEISTGTGSMNVSVVSIPQGGPKSFAEFTCGYKKNISGRWILSHRSRAVNVTVTAKASPGSIQAWPPRIPQAAGCVGAAALLPLLLLLICHCWRRNGTAGGDREEGPLYVNRHPRAGTALQQRSRDGQVQPVTHNQPARPNIPGGKPVVGRNPQGRGKREEDADARAINTVYSMLSPPSAVAEQRGGKEVSEAVVYSKIPY
ncbi:unnamed protein product [Eretmochelys imbricata]